MTRFAAPISEQIWDMKYRLKEADGTIIDETVEDTWKRIANANAKAEKTSELVRYREEFYNSLEGFKFLPAGRITSGSGTGRNVTLFNCFVMGTIPDDMSNIFENLREAALTMQQGGGIGYDFSTLRPFGSEVKGVASDASGPLSFMDVWDAMCRTIMSAGERRGAMMGTMRCDHPDVEAFIEAKSDPNRLRKFNMSVLITDAFMIAKDNNADWDLVFNGKVYKTVKALDLWNKIMKSTYKQAEPGVIFIDRINKKNNLHYCETISATNPCGEQPLPPYGACLLGSINLAMFVQEPFSDHFILKSADLAYTVRTAIRMLDNVIDISKFPLEEQKIEAHNKRRIGLGVTGVADMLAMMKIPYGSKKAQECLDEVMRLIARNAYFASCDLAEEKGSFPLFDADEYIKSEFIQSLGGDIVKRISKVGIRNSHLISIAPTGTISLYAGNVSSGIEPIFAFDYTRKILNGDGTHRFELVEDYAVNLYRQMFPNNDLPNYFVSAQTLTPKDHLDMQAVAQRWVDSAISKTINCPEDISFEDFKGIYDTAYRNGCKGCTTYRPNDITGSVISVEPEEQDGDSNKDVEPENLTVTPTPRPEELIGSTYKLKWEGENFYVTINDFVQEGQYVPFEIFINSKDMQHFQWIIALTRMLSAVFRRGGDVSFVVDELKNVFDPKGGAWVKGSYIPSFIALLGGCLEKHLKKTTYLSNEEELVTQPKETTSPLKTPDQCPACKEFTMVPGSGCPTCSSCGHSKCG